MRSLVQLGKELKTEVAVDTMMMMVAPTKKQKAGMTAVTASGTLLGSIATFFCRKRRSVYFSGPESYKVNYECNHGSFYWTVFRIPRN